MRIPGLPALLAVLSASIAAYAQSKPSPAGCEGPPEVRQAFEGPLSQEALVKLTQKDRLALEQRTLDDLQAKYRIALGRSDPYGDNRSVDGYGLDVDVVLPQVNSLKPKQIRELAQLVAMH